MSRKPHQFSPARKEQHLSKALDKRLAAYVTAATAAGVAMLAVPDAAAKIRYTPVHVLVASGATYWIDFNHDGTNDFGLHRRSWAHAGSILLAIPGDAGVNEVVQAAGGFGGSAAALMAGAAIGPNQKFASRTSYAYGGFFMAFAGSSVSGTFFKGPWKDQINKYLGLKFFVNGEFHYGWVRMTVTHNLKLTAITGFAYETEPNKPIRAGNESGTYDGSASRPLPAASEISEPATLGVMAIGWSESR